MRTITTNGADIHVMERPGGGFAIQQGRSHLLVTNVEATALARVLNEMVQAPRLVIPAHE